MEIDVICFGVKLLHLPCKNIPTCFTSSSPTNYVFFAMTIVSELVNISYCNETQWPEFTKEVYVVYGLHCQRFYVESCVKI